MSKDDVENIEMLNLFFTLNNEDQEGSSLKIFTTNQMLCRLPSSLTQLKHDIILKIIIVFFVQIKATYKTTRTKFD